jgi:hypothetical protein
MRAITKRNRPARINLSKPVLEPLPQSMLLYVYRLNDKERQMLKVDRSNPGVIAVIA